MNVGEFIVGDGFPVQLKMPVKEATRALGSLRFARADSLRAIANRLFHSSCKNRLTDACWSPQHGNRR